METQLILNELSDLQKENNELQNFQNSPNNSSSTIQSEENEAFNLQVQENTNHKEEQNRIEMKEENMNSIQEEKMHKFEEEVLDQKEEEHSLETMDKNPGSSLADDEPTKEPAEETFIEQNPREVNVTVEIEEEEPKHENKNPIQEENINDQDGEKTEELQEEIMDQGDQIKNDLELTIEPIEDLTEEIPFKQNSPKVSILDTITQQEEEQEMANGIEEEIINQKENNQEFLLKKSEENPLEQNDTNVNTESAIQEEQTKSENNTLNQQKPKVSQKKAILSSIYTFKNSFNQFL